MNKTAALFIFLGAFALAGLFLLFQPEPASVPASLSVAVATPLAPASTAPLAQTHRFDWRVTQGRRISGPELIQVRQGDSLMLTLISDHADELHVHGYDLELELKPGEAATLSFEATHTGRFDLELHHAHLELGAIEVLPE